MASHSTGHTPVYECDTVQRVANMEQMLILFEEWRYQEWEYPKLILLDLYRPDNTDGLQLLRAIRALPTPVSEIPIVMLTCAADRANIEHAYQLGISAYIVKPTAFADWLTCIRDLRTYWWETATLPSIQYRF